MKRFIAFIVVAILAIFTVPATANAGLTDGGPVDETSTVKIPSEKEITEAVNKYGVTLRDYAEANIDGEEVSLRFRELSTHLWARARNIEDMTKDMIVLRKNLDEELLEDRMIFLYVSLTNKVREVLEDAVDTPEMDRIEPQGVERHLHDRDGLRKFERLARDLGVENERFDLLSDYAERACTILMVQHLSGPEPEDSA